ncbi:IPT/TIG domain-containing protein [Sandaracinus amylolyticus]|uniref:IPT/TIG domain-containing protein n=1 Tax=Sandaracinus amylolyticus TaxID=927083 RepID=UPI001F2FC54E|nr:IPT/TIG domain-containing protein [Sandaracinus amylolyticus]UJR87082.1 Hypothetical protein I5071_91830 [Sandaracinus amylolyticus]
MRIILRALPFVLALFAALIAPPAHAQVEQPPPVIERLEPTSGPPGTVVQMIGRYFRPGQQVRLAGQPVEVLSQMPNRWTLRIPQGAQSGRIAVEVPGITTTIGPEFRVLAAAPPPVITDLQPRAVAPGAEVRIVGENFSPRITENLVTLGGVGVVVRTATPNELVVIVPPTAQTGRFTVRVAGSGETVAPFDLQIGVPLAITGFSPAVGAPGTQVTISGSGFHSSPRAQQVFIGNTAVRVVSASPTAIVIEVPPSATSGVIMVDIRRTGRAYSSTPFVVQAAPVVASFDPPAGPPGSMVRVRGSNFGTDVRVVQVIFGNVPGVVRGLSAQEIVVEIPQGAASGPISVIVNGVGPVRSSGVFSVLSAPAIADFQPRSGGVGTEVVITGSGFSPVAAQNRVSISGVAAQVIAAAPTQLRVRMPAAASGPIQVEVQNAGTARSGQPFVVTTPPFIARFEPAQGLPGSVVTIHGASFGNNAALVEAAIGDRRMQLRSVTDQRIEAVIPEGATSGQLRVTVRLQGSAQSQQVFNVLGAFTVSGLEPANAYPGQWLTIRGSGFTPTGMEVRFAGVPTPVPYTFVSSAEIRVVVPMGASSGALAVRTADGREASPRVDVTPPPGGMAITSVESRGCVRQGCTVIVRGHGFGARPNDQWVTFGGQRVRVRRASPVELELNVHRRMMGTATFRVQTRSGQSAESAAVTLQ